MNKLNKVIINAIIFLLIFVVFDILFFYFMAFKDAKEVEKQKDYIKQINIPSYFVSLKHFADEYEIITEDFRPVLNENNNESPIIIFGCSYAHGYVFDNEETISYILSKYSKRPIYNRAYNSWSVQHAIYQLKEDANFYNNIKSPRYVIYVLLGYEHLKRLFYTNFNILEKEYYLSYKINNGNFIERRPLFKLYYNLAIFRYIHDKVIINYINSVNEQNKLNPFFNVLLSHLFYLQDLINLRWGGGNFIK